MPAESGTLIMFNSYLYHGFGVNNTKEPRISLPFNVLANLSDRDSFKMDFVKQERWLNNDDAARYTVKGDVTTGGIERLMSK